MSRKMIDYQVEGNKISTIDGYKVGGDELTGAAIMGVSKDSDSITRTLDTDGKVKFNNVNIPQVDTKQILDFEIGHNKEYTAGDYIISEGVDLGKGYSNLLVQYLSLSGSAADMNTKLCAVSNTAEFRLLSLIPAHDNTRRCKFYLICTKSGTSAANGYASFKYASTSALYVKSVYLP